LGERQTADILTGEQESDIDHDEEEVADSEQQASEGELSGKCCLNWCATSCVYWPGWICHHHPLWLVSKTLLQCIKCGWRWFLSFFLHYTKGKWQIFLKQFSLNPSSLWLITNFFLLWTTDNP
jgi:hypothetical protein